MTSFETGKINWHGIERQTTFVENVRDETGKYISRLTFPKMPRKLYVHPNRMWVHPNRMYDPSWFLKEFRYELFAEEPIPALPGAPLMKFYKISRGRYSWYCVKRFTNRVKWQLRYGVRNKLVKVLKRLNRKTSW